MTINEYLNNLGFKTNPFQFSNADKETEFLSDYFIKPDCFEDIWGDPYDPVSSIIYAPAPQCVRPYALRKCLMTLRFFFF
jgi:hypothetical protein